MASTPSPPLRPIRHTGTRDFAIRLPDINEAIMLRLPFEITLGPPSIISTAAVTNATGANYHLCFVSGRVVHRDPPSVQLDLWVCLGFSSALPSPQAFVRSLPLEWQECLLPLPCAAQVPMIDAPATPVGFGPPLVAGGFVARKPCWLNVRPVPVRITAGAPFKRFHPPGILSDEEVTRLEMYALRVPRLTLPIQTYRDDEGPPPDGTDARAPAPGAPGPSTAPPEPETQQDTEQLLDTWYPGLKHMVCAEDASSDGSDGDGDGLSWEGYERLFVGAAGEEARRVEVRERVGGWLVGLVDGGVR